MLSKSAVSATTVVNFLICSSWFSFVLVVFLSLIAPLISVPSSGAIVLLTESAECQRAEGEAQIAQRYVEVARKYKQVENDAYEPSCDDVSENPWLDSHPDACGDLDYPHNGSVATLQSPGDSLAGCSSWHLRFAVYSSGGNLSRRSSCWRWDGTCAFPCRTATSKSCSPSGVCTPTTSRWGDGFSGMRPNFSGAYAAT